MTRRAHVASHPLPTSNGWSGGPFEVSVWCGRCKDLFQPDRAWVNRYFDRKRDNLQRNGGFDPIAWRPFTADELAGALRAIEQDRDALLREVTTT